MSVPSEPLEMPAASTGSAMFSEKLKAALEREVVGQPGAVNMIVRGVTRAISGFVTPPQPLCTFLLMGPSGTGRTHIARALARTLHGDETRFLAADCTSVDQGDPWQSFVVQLLPLFGERSMGGPPAPAGRWTPRAAEAPAASIVVIGDLERGRPEFGRLLIRSLKTGHLPLPGGGTGSMAQCIVFLTSSLCATEILSEKPGIGFSAAREAEEERARTFRLCTDAAIEHWGLDLIARLDDLVVFHRLEESHLAEIADRHVESLNERLSHRGFRCQLTERGREFLLERGMRDPRMGARCLVRACRKHLEFPVADLALSGRVPEGGVVRIDRKAGDDHLHFDVEEPERRGRIRVA